MGMKWRGGRERTESNEEGKEGSVGQIYLQTFKESLNERHPP